MHEILIIEDETAVRSNIAELLQSEGYYVRQAENGEEGYKMALESIPDLIICDILMPGMDGYTVKNKLGSIPDTAAIPFIFLTALSEKEDFRKGMDSGADDYITKPFTRNTLLHVMQTRLEKRKMFERLLSQNIEKMRRSDQPLPIEMLTPMSVILGYSDLLSNLGEEDFFEIEKIKSIAREINKSAIKVFDFMQQLIFKDELEMVMISSQKIKQLRDERLQISNSMMVEWLATGIFEEEGLNIEVDLELADLAIFNEYLFKIFEILLGFVLDEIGRIDKFRFVGKRKAGEPFYSIQMDFEFLNPFPGFVDRLIRKWHSLPRNRPLDFTGIKIFNVNIMMELFACRLSFLRVDGGLRIELIVPSAN